MTSLGRSRYSGGRTNNPPCCLPFTAMSFANPFSWSWVLLCVLGMVTIHIRSRQRRRHLPPGPPALPLIGNVFDFPRNDLGSDFKLLSQKYGACTHSIRRCLSSLCLYMPRRHCVLGYARSSYGGAGVTQGRSRTHGQEVWELLQSTSIGDG